MISNIISLDPGLFLIGFASGFSSPLTSIYVTEGSFNDLSQMSRKAGLGWMQCLLKSTPGIGSNNPDDHPDPSEDPGGREREQGDRHLGVQLSAHSWDPLHQHGCEWRTPSELTICFKESEIIQPHILIFTFLCIYRLVSLLGGGFPVVSSLLYRSLRDPCLFL